MDARQAHLKQQVQHPHGGCDEQYLAGDLGNESGLAAAGTGKHILDVDHADDVIEGLAIDGQAGVGRSAHQLDQVWKGDVGLDGNDFGARHHLVLDRDILEGKDVLDEDTLVGVDRDLRFLALLDQLLEGFAD